MFVYRQPGRRIEVQAPAKLNLFLEVLDRRADGFHELDTLMTAVTLYDRLTFTPRAGDGIELACRWTWGTAARDANRREQGGVYSAGCCERLPVGERNLAFRAARHLQERAKVHEGATIELIKRIPAAAGLGGASSDAAAVLVAANEAWNVRWPLARLAELAAELGSDVPFFLAGGAARCTGRGERTDRWRCPAWPAVVVRPPGGLSTAEVFARCRPAEQPQTSEAAQQALSEGRRQELARLLHNRLTEPAESLSPWIARVRRLFADLGCPAHQMSGSGSSYFGLCRHDRHARRVAGRLRGAGCGEVFQVTTLLAA